ncbi:hypothetical protein FOYG_16495 [Fusarium oxysporum NRRL 32931]|uniref:Uncharacterized protein n=1 Tax=Fusarium oxysporum NRRL 32931 TaxID=660029 RepID=W9HK13_FUSOX|nr:hypothetical protein FOYG_16495 [Fusarium oxysporum NRRL 32931]
MNIIRQPMAEVPALTIFGIFDSAMQRPGTPFKNMTKQVQRLIRRNCGRHHPALPSLTAGPTFPGTVQSSWPRFFKTKDNQRASNLPFSVT